MSLIHDGYNASKLHIVGHSLGGQIAGAVGLRLADYGVTEHMVTGVDAAGERQP